MAADWKVESAQKCTNKRIWPTSGCFDSVLFISNPNFKFLLTKLFLKTGFSYTEFQLFLTISLPFSSFFPVWKNYGSWKMVLFCVWAHQADFGSSLHKYRRDLYRAFAVKSLKYFEGRTRQGIDIFSLLNILGYHHMRYNLWDYWPYCKSYKS